MTESRVERHLAAILAADVVGFSRLMEANEAGTLASLKSRRQELLSPLIAKYQGRLVKMIGDGALVEFVSAVNAVQCAIEIQKAYTAANEVPVANQPPIVLRIGITLGDVVVEGNDIYGDGVNIAARLEGLAEPGGICISAKVHAELNGKIDDRFEYAGEQQLKNISAAVGVFRYRRDGTAVASSRPDPHPAMPNKPSIAVLPFQNISGDPAQDYFTDGMVEEIITALSRFGELFVIARNSSFVYKGRQVDVKQVGHELGVRYVLEGSVRTAGSRVRITGQLIDTKTGAHIWADRFDGALEDVFDLQDNLTARVVGAIAPKIEHAEIERSQRKPTGSLDAYDYYLHGLAAMHEWSQKANDNALAHLHQAIKLDPNFAAAHGLAARCYVLRKTARWTRDNAAEAAEALRLAQRAIEIGADDAVALCTGGFALLDFALDFELADASIERALALNPNSAWAWLFSSWSKICKGEADEGIVRVQKAMRLSPQDPQLFSMRSAVACAHFVAGRYDEAIVTAEAAMVERPGFVFPDCIAAISAALVGRTAEANRFIEHILRIAPDLCVASAMDMIPFKRGEDSARWAEGLRRAGLPD